MDRETFMNLKAKVKEAEDLFNRLQQLEDYDRICSGNVEGLYADIHLASDRVITSLFIGSNHQRLLSALVNVLREDIRKEIERVRKQIEEL